MSVHWLFSRRGIQIGLSVLVLSLLGVAVVVAGLRAQPKVWTAQQVVDSFVEAGLDVVDVAPMTANEFLAAPKLAKQALFFPVWELKLCFCSEVPKAFVMSFDDLEGLEQTRTYYDKLEEASIVFATWTLVRGNVLVVLPGGLNEQEASGYEAALLALR